MKKRFLITSIALTLAFSSTAATAVRRRAINRLPTFSREVVRIFQQNCQSCHRAGGAGPFPLTHYGPAAALAASIAEMVTTRQMPPWKPAEGCGDFMGTRRLTQSEIDTIVEWARIGAPEGSRAELPPQRTFSSDPSLGKPDVRMTVESPYTAPARSDSLRSFVFPPSDKTRYVSAIDFHPTAREVVHHMIAYIDYTGISATLDAADPGPGYTTASGPGFTDYGLLGSWFPGADPFRFAEGVAVELPAGARVVLQVHYHDHHGHVEPDQSGVSLYFSRAPVTKLLRFLTVDNHEFTIPAGDPAFTVDSTWTLPKGIQAHTVGLHSHRLGRRMRFETVAIDGSRECLLQIDRYDWKWQGMYRYNQPRAIPGGTTLRVEATYDNSSANPENPNNPPKDVAWGEWAFNEMCVAYMAFTWDDENVFIVPE